MKSVKLDSRALVCDQQNALSLHLSHYNWGGTMAISSLRDWATEVHMVAGHREMGVHLKGPMLKGPC